MLTAKDIALMEKSFLTKKEFVEAKKDLLTKKEFMEAKKDLLTKKEFMEAKKDLLTKKEFMVEKSDLFTKQDGEDFKHELRNDLLDFKDAIITEIKALRLETEINSSFRQKIEKQDKRIDRLESAVFN